MNNFKTALLGGVCLALSLISPSALAAGENVGINAAVKGNVTVRSGQQEALQALVKAPVFLDDEINASHNSSLQVLLLDETVFTVGPDCLITIDKFVYDPAANNNNMSASVTKGMFRFMSGNISKSGPDSVSIDTPVASMGVRGTMVEGLVGAEAIAFALAAGIIDENTDVDTQGASLFVLRGPGRKSVAKNNKGEIDITSGGKTVTLNRSGMAVFVATKNSPPSKIFFVSDRQFQTFDDIIRTNPTGGPSYKPFALDPYMEWEPPVRRDDEEEYPPLPEDPSSSFDWPELEDQTGNTPGFINCTPADPDYPDCL